MDSNHIIISAIKKHTDFVARAHSHRLVTVKDEGKTENILWKHIILWK